jgi:hypothetical protein
LTGQKGRGEPKQKPEMRRKLDFLPVFGDEKQNKSGNNVKNIHNLN